MGGVCCLRRADSVAGAVMIAGESVLASMLVGCLIGGYGCVIVIAVLAWLDES